MAGLLKFMTVFTDNYRHGVHGPTMVLHPGTDMAPTYIYMTAKNLPGYELPQNARALPQDCNGNAIGLPQRFHGTLLAWCEAAMEPRGTSWRFLDWYLWWWLLARLGISFVLKGC